MNPEVIDLQEQSSASNRERLECAFHAAHKHLGIPRLLDPEGLQIYFFFVLLLKYVYNYCKSRFYCKVW